MLEPNRLFSVLFIHPGLADFTPPKGWHLSSLPLHRATRANLPTLVTFWPDCHSLDCFEPMAVPGTKPWVKGSLWIAGAGAMVFAQARGMHNSLAMRWSKPDIPLVVMITNVKNRALFYTPMGKKKHSLAGPREWARVFSLSLGTGRGSPATQVCRNKEHWYSMYPPAPVWGRQQPGETASPQTILPHGKV